MAGYSEGSGRPNQWLRNLNAKIASVPMILTAVVIFLGGTIWTVVYSFTNSKLLPRLSFVGLDQYERLWDAPRWLVSVQNLAIYGIFSLIFSLVIGFVLAALMDQKIRFENTFRTIMLYPFALSFIVTGLVWQWLLNPEFGIQSVVRSLGWESFTFDPLYNSDIVIYGILIAALWQGTGLVMCLMLAGLRGIDEDIWKAARVDGIPMWKTYLFVVIPMMRGVFITTLVIIASGIVKVYDLVVAQTSGGPGIASEVPAKYVYDYMFQAQNLGQGFAASTMMLITVAIIIVPWAYLEFGEGASVSDIVAFNSVAEEAAPKAQVDRVVAGPRGRKPRRALSSRNIVIYGTLIVVALYYLLPLYVMVMTSLKGMPEIRLGNIFAPPLEITFEPWVKAWASACTGLNCDGLSRGFWNSVRITVPSTIVSIAIASVNGYALANWRFKGRNCSSRS